MSSTKFEVQTRFYDDSWLNVWTQQEGQEEPVRTLYDTEQEALDAIGEFIEDTTDRGLEYSRDDYRVVRVNT